MASTLADILVTLTLDTGDFSDRLKRVGQELNDFRNHVRQVTNNMEREFSGSMGDMGQSVQQITQATQQTSQQVQQNMSRVTESIERVSNSSRTLARELGTSLEDSQKVLQSATREFHEFGGAGRRVSMEIQQEFSSLPRHLQLYAQRLREAGKSTEGFARLNEQYGERMIESMRRSNEFLQQKTTQSMKLMRSFAENTNLAPLTNGFLRLGNRMEETAKQGTPLNIALQRIGNNKSLKALNDEMRFIQQGIMRARGAFIVFGLSSLFAVGGMIALANAVDKRVAPAFENMKKNLIDAFEPFIHAFATGLVAVMNFVSSIAKMINKFSEAHPVLFNMIMFIGLLTLVLGTLLSPLAVTGVLAEGVAASFTALWTAIAPFVVGVLAVIGVALALATVFVVLWVSIQNLWKNSEAFRNAFINLWNDIKTAIVNNVVTPVIGAWNRLKGAFTNLIATFTGGSGTMTNLWKWLGDNIAIAVNYLSSKIMPILSNAFSLLGQIAVAVINGIIIAVNWLAQMWKEHGDTIKSVISTIWGVIQTVFSAVYSYIVSIMPQIVATISSAWDLIKTAIDFTMKYIMPVVIGAFKVIWSVIQFLMPMILSIIVGTWENIKAVITNTINIIKNVIQLFSNILKGNWSGVWNNIKEILKSSVLVIWNLIQLYFLGKLLAPLRGFITAGKGIIKAGWTSFLTIIRSILTGIKTFIVTVWNAIGQSLRGSFTGIVNTGKTMFTALKTAITTIFNGIKSTATTVWNGVKNAIVNPIKNAKDTVLKIVSAIVKAFAGMKISIPKIKLPKIDVGSKSFMDGKVKIPTFKVSWNAKGNIFNGASILGGGQGVGEAGAEAK